MTKRLEGGPGVAEWKESNRPLPHDEQISTIADCRALPKPQVPPSVTRGGTRYIWSEQAGPPPEALPPVALDSIEAATQIEKRFLALAILWKYGRPPTSSVSDMVLHPAYQQIIGMGRPVLPLVLRELEREADHWFFALTSITGADPIPWNANGDIKIMAAAWLKWGKQYGIVGKAEIR